MRLPARDLGHRPLQEIQLRLRLVQCDPRFEARDDRVVELTHPADVCEIQAERHDCRERGGQRGRFSEHVEGRQLRSGPQDADDGVLGAAEDERAADDVGTAAESIGPETLADHGDRRAVGLFVLARQRPPECHRHVEHVEDGARCAHDRQLRGFACSRQARRPPIHLGDRRERRRLAAPFLEVPGVGRHRGVPVSARRLDLAKRHEALRLAIRKRAQDDAVQNREHRGRGAKGQGQRGDDGRGIDRVAPQGSHRVAKVEEGVVHAGLDGHRVTGVVAGRCTSATVQALAGVHRLTAAEDPSTGTWPRTGNSFGRWR